MLRYALRRIILLGPLLLGLTLLTFVISRALPGDPVGILAGPHATPAEIARISEEFGFDQPLPLQYLTYLGKLVQGDWGISLFTRRPVFEEIAIFLPATLELVIATMLLAVLIGIPVGVIAAVNVNRWPDMLNNVLGIAAISMPRFFLGLLLQLAFAMALAWLPLGGRYPLIMTPPPQMTGLVTVDALLAGDLAAFGVALKHLILPTIAMALSPIASVARVARASTIEALQQDYVMTERALGLSERLIVFKYVLKNALSATLTVLGLMAGWLLSGTVLVETVFDWPGLGLYATQAIISQDFNPIMGVTLVIGILFVLINLGVDLLYGVVNPKVKYA